MKQKIFIVDAFTDVKFGGNPACVIPLETWLSKELMQKIAMENNQAETAFFVRQNGEFDLKWFTPTVEVELCGHATLASAHVLWNHLKHSREEIKFNSNSGDLFVRKDGEFITLDFPVDYFQETEAPPKLIKGLGFMPQETYIGKTDYLCIMDYEEKVKRISPDFNLLGELKARGVIVTAKSYDVDFVYRFFAPGTGIPEDPATGSAQTTLMNYWSKKLNKTELTSLQLSNRIGKFTSKIKGDRVEISGNAITYLEGEIEI